MEARLLEDPRFAATTAHLNVKEVAGYPTKDAPPGILKSGQEPKEKASLTDEDYRVNLVSASGSINAPGYEHGQPFVYVESNPQRVIDGSNNPVINMTFHVPDVRKGSREVQAIGLMPKNGTAADTLDTVIALLNANHDFKPVHAMGIINAVIGHRAALIGSNSPEEQREVDILNEARRVFNDIDRNGPFEAKTNLVNDLDAIVTRERGPQAGADRS